MKTTTVTFNQTQEEETYKHVSKHYIVDAMGNLVYFHCRDRSEAQKAVDEEYGKGKYKIRIASTEKGGGTNTVKCSVSNKSRSGQYMEQIRSNQGRGCD